MHVHTHVHTHTKKVQTFVRMRLILFSLMMIGLWVAIPLRLKDPFTGVAYQIDIYIHNSSKISYEAVPKIILCLRVTTTWETVLKGCSIRKAEDHRLRQLLIDLNF